MKFVTQKKYQLFAIIALSLLISQSTSIKFKVSDFNSDPEIASLLVGDDQELNSENMFEDLNFLENTNLIRNSSSVNLDETKKNTTNTSSIVDLSQAGIEISGWFAVSNVHFNDPQYYPVGTKVTRKEVDFSNLSGNNFLVNQLYKQGSDILQKNELMFFFRFKDGYLYFTNDKKTLSVVDSIKLVGVKNSDIINSKVSFSDTCFDIIDNKNWSWTLCADNIDLKKKWLCSMEKLLKLQMDPICGVVKLNNNMMKQSSNLFSNETKSIKKMFIIPKESPRCNANWNYNKNGSDWECTCSEGINQSPINLPKPNKKMMSKIKPLFLYDIIQPIAKESSIDGLMKENEPIKIYNRDGLLKIMHSNLGKIVLSDGGVYHGEEIVFHTPSEHMINGKRFDMEVQIIHYGVSKGDIAKQVVISFLFYVKPGVFNEFLDKIDVYNLPNEIDQFRDITSALNIPTIFYSNVKKDQHYDDEQIPMKDFSFYQYEGSLTTPPCTERTTVIVASEPLPISNTFVELFKEALRTPEYFGIDGKLYSSGESPKLNARNVQPLNGRKISFYQSQIQGVN